MRERETERPGATARGRSRIGRFGLLVALAAGACAPADPERGFAAVRVARFEGDRRVWGLDTAERMGLARTLPDRASPVEAPDGGADGSVGPAPELQRQAGLEWELPAGWSVAPPRPFRVVTLRVEGLPELDCGVTVLRGDGGGVEANLERWAGQITGPAGPAELVERGALTLLGGEGLWVLLEGASDGTAEPPAILGALRRLPERTVFVKLGGPLAAVRAARPAFLAFCASLREERP